MPITPNDPADFGPTLGNYTELKPFRYWCQKVLPLVYDDSLSYYELLGKVVNYLNVTMQDVETLHGDVTALNEAYTNLQNYVNNYFSSLDVQQEINNKLDEMASDGSLSALIEPFLNEYTEELANVNTKYNSLQTQVNDLVLQAGSPEPTAAEIAQARGSFETLNERLKTMFASATRLSTAQSSPLNDLNTFPANLCYELSSEGYTSVANKPNSTGDFATVFTFTGYGEYVEGYTTGVQIYIDNGNYKLYYRMRANNIWSEWKSNESANVIELNNDINIPMTYNSSIIKGNGHAIDLGIKLTGSTAGIQNINFEYSSGDLLDRCFVSKTTPLMDTSSQRSNGYYVTMWDDENNKLTPTLNDTPNENEFTYDGTKFIINSSRTAFILNSLTEEYGAIFNNCTVYNLKILHACKSCAYTNTDSNFYDCEFGFSSLGEGLELNNANADVHNCDAYYNRNDGFNIHATSKPSNTIFINCNAYNNFDDGISHHDNSNFSIIGGEYFNNNKGGISSPTYGANGFISGCYTHDNQYGILCTRNEDNESPILSTLLNNCIIENNNVGISTSRYRIIAFNIKLINNTSNTEELNGGEIIEK